VFGRLEADCCDKRYQTITDHWPVELEVCEFLYGLVRAIKPTDILECGTNVGYSAAAMGLALRENMGASGLGYGHLTTLDVRDMGAVERFKKLNIEAYVTFKLADSTAYQTDTLYDLIFLDTIPDLVLNELYHYEANLAPGAIIAIHDSIVMPSKMEQANRWMKGKNWRTMRIQTARGLDLLRREQ
jgi:predicted O-methyltransferase YrrM